MIYIQNAVACTGFILVESEKKLGGTEKNKRERLAPEGSEIFFCPPIFFWNSRNKSTVGNLFLFQIYNFVLK